MSKYDIIKMVFLSRAWRVHTFLVPINNLPFANTAGMFQLHLSQNEDEYLTINQLPHLHNLEQRLQKW